MSRALGWIAIGSSDLVDKPEKDSKTEQPTPKKIRDALDEGNVPNSREMGTLASLAGVVVAASFVLSDGTASITGALKSFIDNPGEWRLENAADASNLFQVLAVASAGLVLPVALILVSFGLAASFLQNAPRLVAKRIKPELSRLSIFKGFTRIYGAQGRVEFLKATLKLLGISIGGAYLLLSMQGDVLRSMLSDPRGLPALLLASGLWLFGGAMLGLAVLAVADIFWSRYFWFTELRMTRQEVKDEMKQSEGDPIVRSRLRSLARDRSRRRMMAAVPKATLVIANPTHFAVALRYVREEGPAPLVVAKGADLVALKIREIAEANDIPVIEDKALARALYDSVQVDQLIPPAFYKAVAEIVLHLMKKTSASSTLAQGR